MVHLIDNWSNVESERTVLLENEIESAFSLARLAAERTLISHQAEIYEVCILMTNDEELKTLNQRYRAVNKPTDVLAFPVIHEKDVNYGPMSQPLILGDIAISISTARRQAVNQSHSLEMELVTLTIHGTLHLLGFDHLNEKDAECMFKEQQRISDQISNMLGWPSTSSFNL